MFPLRIFAPCDGNIITTEKDAVHVRYHKQHFRHGRVFNVITARIFSHAALRPNNIAAGKKFQCLCGTRDCDAQGSLTVPRYSVQSKYIMNLRPIGFKFGLFLTVIFGGCAGLDTRLPEISAPDLAKETQFQETEALRKIESDAGKLLNAAWPVLTANADLCPKVRPAIGVKTHSLESYPKRLRSTSVTACDYKPRLISSTAINAYADGRNITFTTAMMEFTQSENELAMIIGHELAHNTMGHIRKVIGNYIFSLGATRYTRPFESEADYVGLYYLARAGYSTEGVEDFWQRLAKVSPKSINRAKTHPTFPDRYLRIKAARKEILAKQEAGVPLYPNFVGKG